MQRLLAFVGDALRQGTHVALRLMRIMIPVIIGVKMLELAGATTILARAAAPVVSVVGLPPGTAIVLVTSLLTGVYGGLSAFAAMSSELHLNAAQATVLSCFILIAHGLPVEARVAQQAGVRLRFTVPFRLLCGVLFAGAVHLVLASSDLLQGPATNLVDGAMQTNDPGLGAWALAQALSLAKMALIVVALVLSLKVIKAMRGERVLEVGLGPMLRLLGISPRATGITLVGVLLGLSYGGGLIASEAQSGSLSRSDIVYSVALLGLVHSVVEDTALVLLIGADLAIVTAGRLVFAFVVIAMFVSLTRRWPSDIVGKWLWCGSPLEEDNPPFARPVRAVQRDS